MSSFEYGAIFDMDGVLVDNAEYHALAFEKWAREVEIPFDPEYFRKQIFGKQNRDIFEIMFQRKVTEDEVARWADRKESLYRELYGPHLVETPGLNAFLRDLAASGFGLAVGTSGPPENVRFVLKKLGIEELFSAVLTAADVVRSKPDPQIFLAAMERLGLSAARCAVFEDSPSGAQAAVAAKATLIGVATGHPQLAGASRMIRDFTEITAREVIALIQG